MAKPTHYHIFSWYGKHEGKQTNIYTFSGYYVTLALISCGVQLVSPIFTLLSQANKHIYLLDVTIPIMWLSLVSFLDLLFVNTHWADPPDITVTSSGLTNLQRATAVVILRLDVLYTSCFLAMFCPCWYVIRNIQRSSIHTYLKVVEKSI